MGLFVREDPYDDPDVRQVGFNRYKQLLSRHAFSWLKLNLLTMLGALPLAAGIGYAILSSSILLLIPLSILGGMIWGPFLAGLYDGILRGLRDAPERWRMSWLKSWRQNGRESLLSGAITGLFIGMYAFMAALFWWSVAPQTPGTLALYLFSGALFLLLNTLYWPQLVLFRQTTLNRMRNMILFTAKYFWRMAGVTLLQVVYILIYVLLAPWTLLLLPFLGLWYITFLSQILIYEQMDKELGIEEQFRAAHSGSRPSSEACS
ncbi:hypothetical protein [Flavonifractor sp. An306]|uniref:hypothetical protein n=1 Tax=Flavonifractor sp. An306 TaxID=1965629 RepID=UPI000B373FAD|nr:hypothetical protein [Flavonifractor sp. An306]OUO38714.1 hypothetical protein B5F88_11125 [Flavonifractor sp. An306]